MQHRPYCLSVNARHTITHTSLNKMRPTACTFIESYINMHPAMYYQVEYVTHKVGSHHISLFNERAQHAKLIRSSMGTAAFPMNTCGIDDSCCPATTDGCAADLNHAMMNMRSCDSFKHLMAAA
jgi:hypothetical protein